MLRLNGLYWFGNLLINRTTYGVLVLSMILSDVFFRRRLSVFASAAVAKAIISQKPTRAAWSGRYVAHL